MENDATDNTLDSTLLWTLAAIIFVLLILLIGNLITFISGVLILFAKNKLRLIVDTPTILFLFEII